MTNMWYKYHLHHDLSVFLSYIMFDAAKTGSSISDWPADSVHLRSVMQTMSAVM